MGGELVLDQLLLRLELPPTLPALVAVPLEDRGRHHEAGHLVRLEILPVNCLPASSRIVSPSSVLNCVR